MLLVIIAALLFPQHYAVQTTAQLPSQPFSTTDWIKSLGVSLIAVSFTYGGYQQTINFGNDVEKPSKNIPRGIFIGIAIIIILYLLTNLSYFNVVGFERMKNEKEVAYVVIDKIFGTKGASIFSAFLFLGGEVQAVFSPQPSWMMGRATFGIPPPARMHLCFCPARSQRSAPSFCFRSRSRLKAMPPRPAHCRRPDSGWSRPPKHHRPPIGSDKPRPRSIAPRPSSRASF